MTEERLRELIQKRKEELDKCNAIPYKLNIETVNKLEQCFAIDASVEEATYYANISKQCFYDWMKMFPELSDELERLRSKPILLARQEVVNGIANDKEFALKYLSKKKKDEFADRIETTGKDGKDLISDVNDEYINKITQDIETKIKEDLKNNK